jgi:hypothetical protein
MKKLLLLLAFALCSLGLHAQNLTTISASNITDINGTKLAGGQLCFLITDQQDNPISVSIGGGGQALKRGYCSPVAAGVVTTFTVPNPASTQPAGIYYRVTVKDSSSGLEVLRYTQVSFTGATFNFDNYAPQNLGTPAPLSGNSVTGNLSVTGNVAATGTVTGSNIPGAIPGVGSCTNQFVRALNAASAPTCNTVGSSDLAANINLFNPSVLSGSAGTDSTVVAGRTATEANYGVVGTAGHFFTNTDMAAGDYIIRLTSLTNRIYLGAGTGAAPIAVSNTGLNFYTSSGTLPASVVNDGLGGITLTRSGGLQAFNLASTGLFLSPGLPLAFQGSTSGSVSVTQPSTGSGTNTLQGVTDTFVYRATTDTLTNKSFGGAGAAFNGSTSGSVILKATATAGSNTATLPAATGNVVLDSATQTLTNKTLGGTTPVNRVRANQGTPVVVGDWTLSVAGLGSWGSTATITAVSGNDTAGSITILCSGTGQSANPAFKLTFHDGALSAFPIGMIVRGDGNGPAAFPAVFGESTTSITFGFVGGLPVSGISYQFFYWVIGS